MVLKQRQTHKGNVSMEENSLFSVTLADLNQAVPTLIIMIGEHDMTADFRAEIRIALKFAGRNAC